MVDVQATSAASQVQEKTNTATSASPQTTLDYNSFLKLLLAELKNQDPMEPTKGSDYVAQLATFSQVEKSVQMNDRLASVLTASQMSQAEGLMGRTITAADGSMSGIVSAAKISGDGVIAILGNGTEIPITQGVKVS